MESREDMTRLLGHVWGEKGEEKREEPGAAARRPKTQKGRVTKMSGFYRSLWGKGSPASGPENSGWREGFARD